MGSWGVLKSLKGQSVVEVSAYLSCIQFSGNVERTINQAYK